MVSGLLLGVLQAEAQWAGTQNAQLFATIVGAELAEWLLRSHICNASHQLSD
jgi:hypothetical protein